MAVEVPGRDEDAYVVVGLTPEVLQALRSGNAELGQVVEEGGRDRWYLTQETSLDGPMRLELQDGALRETDYLP